VEMSLAQAVAAGVRTHAVVGQLRRFDLLLVKVHGDGSVVHRVPE
jgi:hypothetical protein